MSLKSIARRALRVAARSPAFAGLMERLPGVDALYREPWERMHPFDRAHGIDAGGLVTAEHLGFSGDLAQVRSYLGSQPGVIRAALREIPALEKATFIDMGCGKGRPLVVASEFPFRDLVGVEYSAPLVEIARANARIVASNHPDRPAIRVEQGDAGQWDFPEGDFVLFLYNPFGAELMGRVVARIEAALRQSPRAAYIVYYNPVHGHLFDECRAFTRRFAGDIAYAAEELGYGPDTFDPVVIWQGGTAPPPAQPPQALRIEPEHEYRAHLRTA